MKVGGHNFHPSRVSGKVKFMRNLEVQRQAEKNKKKKDIEPLDLTKQNWSTKR